MSVNYFYKKVKGRKYLFIGETKRVDGKPKRLWQKYIGTPERLNDFLNSSIPRELESISYGLPASLLEINKELDFVGIVDKHAPKRNQGLSIGEHILIDIINRIDDPVSKSCIGAWFSKTILRNIFDVPSSYLSSQNFWNNWEFLDEKQIESIQEDLLPKLIKDVDLKELFYDTTNFTTYIKEHDKPRKGKRNGCDLAKFGHSKNGLKGLRQINLALLVTKDYGMPLWHSTYHGEVNDVTYFKQFMDSLMKKVDIFSKECEHITLVFDKGNNSKDNLKKNEKFFILGSLAPGQYKDLIDIDLKQYEIKHENSKGDLIIAHHLKKEVFGREMDVVLTYNEKTAYIQKIRLEKRLAKGKKYMEKAKSKLNTKKWTDRDTVLLRINTNLTKRYAKDVIEWKLTEKSGLLELEYSVKNESVEFYNKSVGKNILFTDNKSLKPTEIIDAYIAKWVIENAIRKLKNHRTISFSPQRYWTDRSIKVYAFTCVMALTFMSILEKKAADASIKGENLLASLRGIRQGLLLMPHKKNVVPIIEKMDATQSKLYQILNLGAYEDR